MLPFGFPFGVDLAAVVDFFALPMSPCLPMVGNGTGLLGLTVVAGIFGAGTLGGVAKVNGVFAGVMGGVGGRPVNAVASEPSEIIRGFLNIFPTPAFRF